MFFDKIFKPEHIKNLSGDAYSKAKLVESTFTNIVDSLRNPAVFDCPGINQLAALFWDLVGNRITPVAITPAVKSAGLFVEQSGGRFVGMVMVPENWLEMVDENIRMQMGAVIFTASGAKDYWNNRYGVDSNNDRLRRALSFESEFLRWLKKNDPDFKPNHYQSVTLATYPKGIASAGSLHYDGRKYDGVGPPYPYPN